MRRSTVEILREILALGKGTPTDIRYSVNVNYYQSSKYLAFLKDRGFLLEKENGKGRRVYAVTTKGQGLLKKLDELIELLEFLPR